jgi:hypothetical protein
MSRTLAIHTFWKYVSDHLKDLEIPALKKDLTIIDQNSHLKVEDFAMRLSQSGVIYVKISELFKAITQDVTFMITTNLLHLKAEHPLLNKKVIQNFAKRGIDLKEEEMPNYKKVFVRFWIVITSMGDKEQFPLIEEIYKASRLYKYPDDWQIVKYIPPECQADTPHDELPQFIIPVGNRVILPGMLRYDFHVPLTHAPQKSEMEQLIDVMRRASVTGRLEDAPKEEVLPQPTGAEAGRGELVLLVGQPMSAMELMAIQRGSATYFSNLFGEFLCAHRIPTVVVLPEHFFLARYPTHQKCLKPMAGFYEEMHENYLQGVSGCSFCNLLEHNTTLREVKDSLEYDGEAEGLPPGKYCTYCFERLKFLFSGGK